MVQTSRLVFLTSHLQPFLLAGIDALLQAGPVEVILISWTSAAAAPLKGRPKAGLEIHEKTDRNKEALRRKIASFQPHIIYGPGWMDKDYLRWIRDCRKQGAVTIMAMDNHWKGTLKQYLLCLASPW